MGFRTFLFLIGLSSAALHAQVNVVGSDLLAPAMAEDLREFSRQSGYALTVDLGGSLIGMDKLRQGEAGLGLLIFGPGETPPADEFVATPLAWYTAVFAVNAAAPINEITYGKIALIYGEAGAAGAVRWGGLVAAPEWVDRPLVPVMVGGFSLDLVRHEVLRGQPFRSTVVRFGDADAAVRYVAGEPGAIALLPRPSGAIAGCKLLRVAKSEGAVAFAPTPENIHRGDYVLRLPVMAVFRRQDAARLLPVLRHLLGEESLETWRRCGAISPPPDARARQVLDFEML